ncbi:AMP-binding protein [Lentilitoribacter sp. Alg239-R112]|uniref:AMP-binding protein n=1 Tax=Lentilitoribacter sp. Alg239-R112 TaxID=2305987 RepID=UPI0013A6910C|nr:AMP-binding protein [Lentilitoribacter sp. Alg239-R112]
MNYPPESLCYRLERDGWQLPDVYNIGQVACDDWAEKTPDVSALVLADEERCVSYGELRDLSNQCANFLTEAGITQGDRVGILLPQALETAVGHLGVFKLGAISVPLFMLFGPDALQHRVVDAGIKLIITNRDGARKLNLMDAVARENFVIYTVDGIHTDLGSLDFNSALMRQDRRYSPAPTKPDDPAIIIYTSGTTGSPKGALHGHRVLEGHMPGFEMFNDFSAKPGNVMWTPADWAWIGGLFDALMPALASGMTVVAKRFEKFTAEAAFELLSKHDIQHAFLPPTALKMMRSYAPKKSPTRLSLQSVGSGGEALGSELLSWGRDVLDVTINEFYGQTEANLLVSSCSSVVATPPGMMGKAVAGHQLAIIDDHGVPVTQGEIGMIAVKSSTPVMMLNYWKNSEATQDKFIGDWLITGDMGIDEGDNWFRFVGRDDDVITSAGYRIGPGSIEDCLMRHPAVQMAGVVGKADNVRTEIVTAFIVLSDGYDETDELISDLQTHVKTRLAAHEYPREITIVPELPTTATGKIMRRELRKLGGS